MKIYCSEDELSQLTHEAKSLYATHIDDAEDEQVLVISTEEIKAYIAFLTAALLDLGDDHYCTYTNDSPEFARNLKAQLEQILQELQAREA